MSDERPDPLPPIAWPVLLGLGGLRLAVHLALAGRHGYFRDELYFLDCGRHLDGGYVDHAPLIGLLARLALALGGSLLVLRAIAAVAGTALIVLTALLARRLGGGAFAQGLAALCALLAPIYLAVDSIFTMNAFEPLFWMASVLALMTVLERGPGRAWLWVGLWLGAGLMNKHSTAFFGLALGLGLVLGGEGRQLATRWPWLGVAVALLVFAPNLLWQVAHGFPTLEGLSNVRAAGKNVVLGPLAFVTQQLELLHPVTAPVWLAGLARLLLGGGRRHRVLGWTFVAFFLLMLALHAKNYYVAPIYPMLLAAGGVAFESFLAARPRLAGRRWPKVAVTAPIVLLGAALAPLFLPLLEPASYVAYARAVHFDLPKTERHHRGALPQIFGDQFGWPELVREVARIYQALPAAERAQVVVLARNYGEAGAINHLGPALGLPPAVCAHQTHYFWGPGPASGEVMIVLQFDEAEIGQLFGSFEKAGEHFHPWGMEEENRPIYIGRGLRTPLPELWPRLKHWN